MRGQRALWLICISSIMGIFFHCTAAESDYLLQEVKHWMNVDHYLGEASNFRLGAHRKIWEHVSDPGMSRAI